MLFFVVVRRASSLYQIPQASPSTTQTVAAQVEAEEELEDATPQLLETAVRSSLILGIIFVTKYCVTDSCFVVLCSLRTMNNRVWLCFYAT